MLAERMRKLMAYNRWAWLEVFPSLQAVEPNDYMAEGPYFWGSLHGTTVHCLAAESIWLRRCHGQSPTQLLGAADFADFAAVRHAWDAVASGWTTYLDGLADDDFAQMIHYQNTSGEPYTLLLADLVQHVINHATEHRSQITPVLHNLGHPTQSLDFMRFCLKQGYA